MTLYLTSYRPLCHSRFGRAAVDSFGHPPFVDGSSRREPDLENYLPTISGLCRSDQYVRRSKTVRRSAFVRRLAEGDVVVYLTVRGRYGGAKPHRYLTAVLKVLRIFQTPVKAARWYADVGLPIPTNCVYRATGPVTFEETLGRTPISVLEERYRWCQDSCGLIAACKPLFLELWCPPAMSDTEEHILFGRRPATQNPSALPVQTFDRLMRWADLSLRAQHLIA